MTEAITGHKRKRTEQSDDTEPPIKKRRASTRTIPIRQRLTRQSRIRRANFTYWPLNAQAFNPNETAWFKNLCNDRTTRNAQGIRYIQYQTERSPNPKEGTSGLHYQGFIAWHKRERPLGPQFKGRQPTFFYKRTSWHPADFLQASLDYSNKIRTREQNGDHGKGGDLPADCDDTIQDVIDDIRRGQSCKNIIKDHPKVAFHHRHKIIESYLDSIPDRTKAEIYFFVGRPGTGKTVKAKTWKSKRDGDYYEAPHRDSAGRWDLLTYMGQPRLIINELDDSFFKPNKMNTFLDGQSSFQLGRKGSNMMLKSNIIIGTMNKDPTNWYPNISHNKTEALERRFRDYITIYDFTLTCSCADSSRCTCGNHHKMVKRRYPPYDHKSGRGGFKFGRHNELPPERQKPTTIDSQSDTISIPDYPDDEQIVDVQEARAELKHYKHYGQ